ncbi:putative reverse transcriptase domain-containing protein, partial [Tanacetum coccineum]
MLQEELYAKFSKCEFWLSKVQFLGHVIDSEGIHVDPAKIESIKDWESPKTPTKIQKTEAAFQLLKQKLYSASILALPEGSENCVVYCDASHKELGAVLMQKKKVIAYVFCQLKVHEKNYTTHDLESHKSKYFIHPGSDKMYQGPKKLYAANMKAKLPPILLDFLHYARKMTVRASDFLPMREDDSMEKLTRQYLKEVVSRNGVPTDGQSERTIQTLEDMLRACALDFEKGWDKHLSLVEFSYNNSYHTSIKVAPFEALYGLNQKSYVDVRRKPLEFQVGDKVMLKVSPWKGVIRFGKRGKLNPRYIGPFKIIDKVGTVAYRLELPKQVSRVHSMFHVSNLKKCMSDETLAIPLDEIQIDDKLYFIEEPVEIIDREVKRLKQSRISIVK